MPASFLWPLRPILDMSSPDYNRIEDARLEYGDTDQFTCPRCFKMISASRPPVFNSDNCSCVEVAAYNGAMQRTHPSPYEQTPWYEYEYEYQLQAPPHMYPYQPESYASSNHSAPSPEGVENALPNMAISNDFLPLCPEAGLNEAQHRRTSSFTTDMSYQMRRFLVEQESHQPARARAPTPPSPSAPASPSGFLAQETHILSTRPQGKGKGSGASMKSRQSSGSGDMSYTGYGADAFTATGAWACEHGDAYQYQYQENQNHYAMTLSGLSGLVIDE
ncbi:hypothetical protein LAWI1_G001313 [Lachnellula willkommii]|uniref:Uncharacterized protein n=1 Tax=Lachnellula willkommii TaxID=215461 RepID=A0A559MJ31_9HELO|nr:hypothetical protein LAWI1_G001313 [Lachnellula willkommii]